MKGNILIAMALFCCCLSARGSGINDNVDYANYWRYLRCFDTGHGLTYDTDRWFHLLEDTVIDGKTYRRMFDMPVGIDSYSKPRKTATSYIPPMYKHIFVREDNGRILVNEHGYLEWVQSDDCMRCNVNADYLPYHKTNEGDIVLYDFTMKVGDKFASVAGHEDISVVAITDTITEGNITRKLLTLSNGLKVLEGVGCINSPGMFLGYLNYLSSNNVGGTVRMTECKKNNARIYLRTWEDVVKEYYNGIRAVVVLPQTDKRIFNLQGQLMPSPPAHGIYIQEGKLRTAKYK